MHKYKDLNGRIWIPRATDYATSWRDTRWSPETLLSGDIPGTWEIEYRIYSPGDTPDTGWYLYGPHFFGMWLDRHIRDAVNEAGVHLNAGTEVTE